MLGLGAESIIVPVRADKRTLSPAPRRLSFLCTLAPTAAVLYTFVRCSTSEALWTQYKAAMNFGCEQEGHSTNLDDHHALLEY